MAIYLFVIVFLVGFLLYTLSRAAGPCSGVKSSVLDAILFGDLQKTKDKLCATSKDVFGEDVDASTGPYSYDGGNSSICSGSTSVDTAKYIDNPKLGEWVKDASDKYFGGNQALLIAVINVESGWRAKAVNTTKQKDGTVTYAAGLGQFLYSTANEARWVEFHGGTDPKGKSWPAGKVYPGNPPTDDARLDPERSLYAGARYFSETMGYSDLQGFPECKGATGIQLAYCAYIYHYNGGCYKGHSVWQCAAAEKAGNAMKELYAKLTGSGQCTVIAGPSTPVTGVIAGDTSNMTCAAGKDGGVNIGYARGKPYKIRLCNVQGIIVNAQVAENVNNLVNAARSQGIELKGGGFRTMKEQEDLRRKNGCPDTDKSSSKKCRVPTAKAGWSNHQMGVAIDFKYNGKTICYSNNAAWCKANGKNKAFDWLVKNAANFRLFNWNKEAWHWSIDGK